MWVAHPCIFGLISHDVQEYCILILLRHALKLSAKHFAGPASLCLAHQDDEAPGIVLNDILKLCGRVQLQQQEAVSAEHTRPL